MENLRQEVDRLAWYHTITLPGGVQTPGWFDTRTALGAMPFPRSLEGKRCLDVGMCDGFWAFEMERRGAAEVVGIDLDDPAERDFPELVPRQSDDAGRSAATFGLAQRALGSAVARKLLSVYDVTPDAIGRFDFVFIGSILFHLRDPVRALAAIRSVTAGEVLVSDVVSGLLSRLFRRRAAAFLDETDHPRWWMPNVAALAYMVRAAGFDVVASGGPVYVAIGEGHVSRSAGGAGRSLRNRLERYRFNRKGIAHGWVLGRPRAPAEA